MELAPVSSRVEKIVQRGEAAVAGLKVAPRREHGGWIVGSFIALIVVSMCATSVFAIPASPHPYDALQPDGTTIKLRLRGNAHFHWEEEHSSGYTVVRDRGWYNFAKRDEASGQLVSTGLRVGIDNPGRANIRPGIRPQRPDHDHHDHAHGAPASEGSGSSSSAPEAAPAATGSLKNLVVLVRWSDHAGRSVPSVADVDELMNAPGGDSTLAPTGSVRDVYLENSYGALRKKGGARWLFWFKTKRSPVIQ